jgi:heterodisulfide reductase subunit D
MNGRSLADYFEDISGLVDLQLMGETKPYLERSSPVTTKKDLLVYVGCNALRTIHLVKELSAILRAMGFDFNVAGGPSHCCGMVCYRDAPDRARSWGFKSLQHLTRYGARHVVVFCPSCSRQYEELASLGATFPFTHESVPCFLARHVERIGVIHRAEKRIAVHSHTGTDQSRRDDASIRKLLRAIPGVVVLDTAGAPASGWGCTRSLIDGIGATQWQNAISGDLRAAVEAGADIFVTPYYSCQREICQQEANYPLTIVHYLSVLSEAIGVAHRDQYKSYELSANPESTLRGLQQTATDAGLDAEKIRRTYLRCFVSQPIPNGRNLR